MHLHLIMSDSEASVTAHSLLVFVTFGPLTFLICLTGGGKLNGLMQRERKVTHLL